MAEGSRRKLFGRLFTALGFFWLFWAVVGGMLSAELGRNLISVPILPGIVLLFVGRVINRTSSRSERDDQTEPEQVSELSQRRQAPASIRPVSIRPAPSPSAAPRSIQTAPEPEAEAVAAAVDNLQQEIADSVGSVDSRKTSSEMVAEARERFGKRP